MRSRSGFRLAAKEPKLRDKIRNGEPGFEATYEGTPLVHRQNARSSLKTVPSTRGKCMLVTEFGLSQ